MRPGRRTMRVSPSRSPRARPAQEPDARAEGGARSGPPGALRAEAAPPAELPPVGSAAFALAQPARASA
eukprot:302987-Alexandrium_andersonii.AAC.1